MTLQVYIYDIRSTAPLHKLACHSNTVTTVTYHPLYNQVSLICYIQTHFYIQGMQYTAVTQLELSLSFIR